MADREIGTDWRISAALICLPKVGINVQQVIVELEQANSGYDVFSSDEPLPRFLFRKSKPLVRKSQAVAMTPLGPRSNSMLPTILIIMTQKLQKFSVVSTK